MASYHVTRITDSDVYGHRTEACDASGCAGNELRLGANREDLGVSVGDTVDEDLSVLDEN